MPLSYLNLFLVEDKWSAFKDLDFSAPSATATVPGTQASSTSDWLSNSSSAQSDQWGSKETTTNNLWGDSTATANGGGNDLFADSSWSKSTDSTNDAWAKTSGSNDVWATSNSSKSSDSTNLFGGSADPFSNKSKPAGLLPPPKTPTKKETTFSAATEKAPATAAAPAAATQVSNKTRKVEIYEVQFDFESRNADELSLVTNDKIKVRHESLCHFKLFIPLGSDC